jgi:hypothetical protein
MRLSLIFGVVLGLGLGACSDDDGESYNCAEETRDDVFAIGLTKAGEAGKIEFVLLSADPAPPSRGDNKLTLGLRTMAAPAAPITGAVMTVNPFMPDHSHGAGKDVKITEGSEAGQYVLEEVSLWMPGLWEVRIQASTGADTDRAVFKFCLAS